MNSAIDQQIEEAIDCALVEAVQSSVLRRVFSQLKRETHKRELRIGEYTLADWATIEDSEFQRMTPHHAVRRASEALYPLIFWFAAKHYLVPPYVVTRFKLTGYNGQATEVRIAPGQLVCITHPGGETGTMAIAVVTTEKGLYHTYGIPRGEVEGFLLAYCDEAYGLKATSYRRAQVRRKETRDARDTAREGALIYKKPREFANELAQKLHAYMVKVWTPEGVHDRVRRLTSAINSEYKITFEEFLEAKTGVARQKQAAKLRDLMIISKDIIRAVTLLSAKNTPKEKKAQAANTLLYARTRINQVRGLQ